MTAPWGTLAFELFLLEKWDESSSEAPAEQRKSLIREYINLGFQGRHHYHDLVRSAEAPHPSESQISTILAPLRTPSQREMAHQREITYQNLDVNAVWLRTDYSPDSDGQHEELMSKFDVEDAVGYRHNLLNDADLYDFGNEWQRVFSVLPELLDPAGGMLDADDVNEMKEDAMNEKFPPHIEQHIANIRRNLPQERAEEEIFDITHAPVQKAYVVNYLVIEDKQALESGKMLVVFVDDVGQVVRKNRVDGWEVDSLGGMWMQCAYDDVEPWMKGEVGV
ncbi:uncharacterized protein K441DRAFT_659292, partial [Cenococcum geophilum 1.58]|uniref:uncharacterized protein n=1 Tax=Cenococcum geophilum 1.58 TaxID=794803 RepID=UPI00358F1233